MEETSSNFIEELRSKISINDLLQARIEEDPNSVTYSSRVNDFSEGKLIIAWPTNGGMRLLLHDDQLLDFSFIKNGTPYIFKGLVDEKHLEPLPELAIIPSSAINPVQRRQDFRVKCLIPVEVTGTYKEDARNDINVSLNIKTVCSDLSASGISIRLSEQLPEGTLISIKIFLPDDKSPISIPSIVVYADYHSEKQVLYRTGIRYLAISAAERARIVRFLYRAQLQGLRS
jgi:c-di-GMP-binding flagellar brake protein YcgR